MPPRSVSSSWHFCLRSFTWGNVLQLGKVNRLLLAELARRAPLLPGADVLAFIDIDSQQKRIYGRASRCRVRLHQDSGQEPAGAGLNALTATISTPVAAECRRDGPEPQGRRPATPPSAPLAVPPDRAWT